MSETHEVIKKFEKDSLDSLINLLDSEEPQVIRRALGGLRKFVANHELSRRRELLEIVGIDRVIEAARRATVASTGNQILFSSLAQEGISWAALFHRVELYEEKLKLKQTSAETKIKIEEGW
jgi:hypothetical protein